MKIRESKKTNNKSIWMSIAHSKSRGITLIALVITIIVMLILAGVVLTLTIGENGIIARAKKAGDKWNEAEKTEQNQLNSLYGYLNNNYQDSDIPKSNRGKLTEIITPEDYGKTIQYSANGVDNWKVFYNDGKNVYIIASDYLDMSTNPIDLTKTKMTRGNGKYLVYWNNIGTNIEAVGTLNNINNWSAFASGKGGETATGGPTYEMLANSWNQNPKTNTVKLDPTNYMQGITDPTGLYIPHTDALDNCYGYWIATTNTNYPGNSWRAGFWPDIGSGVWYQALNSECNGLRPVVCLKSGVIGTKEDVISIEEEGQAPKTQTLVSQIIPEDYGKTINYSANGVDNWRVFYNDGKNVYIIASNYLDMTTTTIDFEKTKLARENGRYMVTWKGSNVTTNEEVVNILKDTSNWSAFASGKGGETATGSPTYEMFKNSWNQNPKTKAINIVSDENYQAGLVDKTGLYIPHTTQVDNGSGYWIATVVPPSTGYSNVIFHLWYEGAVYYGAPINNASGLRPVVCLKAETTGTVGHMVKID